MNTGDKRASVSIKVSYYSSYKEFKLMGGLQYWPFFACVFLLILFAATTGDSDITVFFLFFSGFILLFCLLVTRFYANAILFISEKGIEINRKDKTIIYDWSEVTNVKFLTPQHGSSYLEIILVIYTNRNDVEYIYIENVCFKTATSKAKEIKFIIEKFLSGYQFIVFKSNFQPILLDKKHGPPKMRA